MSDQLKAVISNLSMLEKIYDIIRIVHPLRKEIIQYDNEKITVLNNKCYSFWGNGKMCPNCVSMRAYNEEETFVKIEYNKEKIYMVMATPVINDSDKYVVELLKDITKTGVVENINEKTVIEIQKLVSEMNSEIIKDALTGIYNRRFIDERLPVDMMKSFSLNKPLSIIMCDIDFFKSVNDNYGHLGGDYILVQFASLLKKNISNNNWVARYGGEEFIIVLNNVDNDTAFNISEKIRKEIEKSSFEYDGVKINITSSFGIYTLDSYDLNIDIKSIIGYADKKLYEAKKTGRNRSVK